MYWYKIVPKFLDLLGTSLSHFRLGVSGPRLKNVSGNIEIRNTGDTANADLTAANIIGSASLKSPIISFSGKGQVVLSGSTNSTTRQANALSIGSGLSVNLAATTTNMIVSFAAGFDQYGAINIVGAVTADTTFSSLTANQSIIYLYLDRNASTGAITTGFSLIAPVSSRNFNGTPSTDQHWYDRNANEMKRYNGSAWVTVQRVFIGTCVTGASTVTSVTQYPYLELATLYEWHPTSRAYEEKVRTAGGTIQEKRLKIIDRLLIWELHEAALLDSHYVLWVGGTDSFTASNLTIIKRSSESEPSFTNLSSSNFYSDGIQGSGNGYINLNHIPSTWYSTNVHFTTAFSRGRRAYRPGGSGAQFSHGVEQGSTQKIAYGSSGDDSSGTFDQWCHVMGDIFYRSNVRGPGGYYVNIANPTSQAEYWYWANDDMRGVHTINRVTSYMSYFYNRQQQVQQSGLSGYSIPTISPFVLACNTDGSPARYAETTVRLFSMGPGLTSNQIIQKQGIIQRFMNEFN